MNEDQLRMDVASTRSLALRAGVRCLFPLLAWAGLLFWAAGTAAWTRAWIHLGLFMATLTANLVILLRTNPDVVAARMMRPQTGARFEKLMLPLFGLALPAIPIVAGLDAVRYAWTLLPSWTLGAGIVGHVAGDAFMLWAMAVNRHLEGGVRIQTDRSHRVVTAGPYAVVRHPMYVGLFFVLAAMPLLLGSGWAFLPASGVVLLLVIRAAFEDRLLRNELPGYEAYTRKTRYRLIPGIW